MSYYIIICGPLGVGKSTDSFYYIDFSDPILKSQ